MITWEVLHRPFHFSEVRKYPRIHPMFHGRSESMVEKTVIWLSILHNDERPNGEKHGYFCQNSYKPFGTTIINILYVKTVVGKAPGKEVYRNNNEPLFVYKNGNISFVETK